MGLSLPNIGGGGLGGTVGDTPIYPGGSSPSIFSHPAPPSGEYPFVGHRYTGDLPGWTYDPWADTYYPNSKEFSQYATKSGLAGTTPNLFEQLLPSLLAGGLKATGASIPSLIGSGVKGLAGGIGSLFSGGSGDSLGSADSYLNNALSGAAQTPAVSIGSSIPDFGTQYADTSSLASDGSDLSSLFSDL